VPLSALTIPEGSESPRTGVTDVDDRILVEYSTEREAHGGAARPAPSVSAGGSESFPGKRTTIV
jgi:hypothetical protein